MGMSGRDGFGRALLELGQENERVVALCADLKIGRASCRERV